MQVVFAPAPVEVYGVLNYLTAAGILASLVVVWRCKLGAVDQGADPGRYLADQVGFYGTLVLSKWFFTLWFRLLGSGDFDSVSEADNVGWFLVSALNPLVLGTTGARLWKSAGSR
ncbi:MAG: hypothetical protein J4G11_02695 [Acidimicrobiia bacterium]|nr:hypothetical protein [Acidimicrobiia bacterium]